MSLPATTQLRDAAQAVVESLTLPDLQTLSKPAAIALWRLTCAVSDYDQHRAAATPPAPENVNSKPALP